MHASGASSSLSRFLENNVFGRLDLLHRLGLSQGSFDSMGRASLALWGVPVCLCRRSRSVPLSEEEEQEEERK